MHRHGTSDLSRYSIQCTCLDYQKRRRHCKHIFFVLGKYLQIAIDNLDRCDEAHYQSIWDKLDDKHHHHHHYHHEHKSLDVDLMATTVASDIPKTLVGSFKHDQPRAIELDEDCAICFETLVDESSPEALLYCANQCGKSIHASCWIRWSDQQHHGKVSSCVHCRYPMSRQMKVTSPTKRVDNVASPTSFASSNSC